MLPCGWRATSTGFLDGNTVRRTGGICIVVLTRTDLTGDTNVDIVNNDIDECHPVDRVAAILVGTPSVLTVSPERPITATGSINIIGNTIRNTSEDCLASAIAFDVFGGRIERNRIVNFIQPCATPTTRNLVSAIWIGLRGTALPPVPAVVPTVRFNDIEGTFASGLRVAANQRIPIDATCNFWGSDQGPSRGPDTGDAVLVEAGAAAARIVPFAKAPIARTTNGGC